MRQQKYSKEVGGTAGCSMRLMEASQYSGSLEKQQQELRQCEKRELYFGDSWFTSRRLAVKSKQKLGHEYFGALKTSHSGTPKDQVENIMKDWPAGSYLILECEDLQLIFIGYKYSYKKKGGFVCNLFH